MVTGSWCRRTILFLCILCIAILIPMASYGGPLDTWYWRSPRPTGNNLNGVAWGNGRFVAVGDGCTILVSSDGVAWRRRSIGCEGTLHGVSWCLDRFLAVGVVTSAGTSAAAIFSSTDGTVWDAVRLEGEGSLHDVAYGNGLFAAVGDGGLILTSPDGLTWDAVSTAITTDLRGLVNGLGKFVAVGLQGRVFTSTNGALWEDHSPGLSNSAYFSRVMFGGGLFVAVGSKCLYSPDGTTWVPAVDPLSYCNDATWKGNQFVRVGDSGRVDTSPDAITWVQHKSPGVSLKEVAWGGGTFLAVGDQVVSRSVDGRTWKTQSHPEFTYLNSVTYAGGRFVAGGWAGGYGRIYTSTNGDVWTVASSFPWMASTGRRFSAQPARRDSRAQPSGTESMWWPGGQRTYRGTREPGST